MKYVLKQNPNEDYWRVFDETFPSKGVPYMVCPTCKQVTRVLDPGPKGYIRRDPCTHCDSMIRLS